MARSDVPAPIAARAAAAELAVIRARPADDASVMFAGLDGKPVSVPISFKGYQQSMSSWKSQEARRSTWFWRLWS